MAPKTRPTTRRPPPTTTPYYHPPPPTPPPDPREECPGSCIVSLLSFTCFRNAEMTDIFKCKKSGTQCCAPKTKIQEHMDRLHRQNHTYHYNPNVGPINPNYPHPPQYYSTNNYPPPPQNYPPPHVYEPTISPNLQQQPSSINYEVVQPTSQKPLPVYSKYVCGVKGTSRVAKSYLNTSEIQSNRRKRSDDFERELAQVYKTKTTERLVLGSNPVPIPIVYTDNQQINDLEIVSGYGTYNTSYLSHRQKRVVGGEDADNGEWCWQVALINSLNQYLCGGALIGN